MRSLTTRLALTMSVVVALTGLAIGTTGFILTERQVENQVDQFLVSRADAIVAGRRGRPLGNRNSQQTLGSEAAAEADASAQLLDRDGEVVGSTGAQLPIGDADLAIAANPTVPPRFTTVTTDIGPVRVYTLGLPEGGAVQVGRPVSEANDLITGLGQRLVWIIVSTTSGAAVIGLLLARWIGQPIRSLASTVDKVATTQDFSVPIQEKGTDEVRRLSQGFQNLLASLQESQERQHQLVQNVAHDLRTPLTSIRANVDLLHAIPNLHSTDRKQATSSLDAELRALTHLVNEMIDLASRTDGPLQGDDFDLAELVGDAVHRFTLRTGRTVDTSLYESPINGDATSLMRAVANLLSNADKYSPATSPISVAVPGDGWVHIADNGIGVPPELQERVFDRFYRVDAVRHESGSGLGLPIVKSIAAVHGGIAWLVDNPDGGTIASLYIPLKEPTTGA